MANERRRFRSRLPSLDGRSVSAALSGTDQTLLGKAIAPRLAGQPGESGVHPLWDPQAAFAVRMRLAETAERCLDVQYYIWRADVTGTLLMSALRAAADRGVRVRLLLDDNNTVGLDARLAALDGHPNVEVRLFNPFAAPFRRFRLIGYLADFSRLNRRMHNKSFTADNQATIVGGRNVGDEYFGTGTGFLFADLDILAVGPVVAAVSDSFDRYWASGSSFPIRDLLPPATPELVSRVEAATAAVEKSPAAVAYIDAIRKSSAVAELVSGTAELDWARVEMVADDPAKGLGLAPTDTFVFERLRTDLSQVSFTLSLVSPYFVPTEKGVGWFARLAKRGVRVAVLTNSLEATDIAAVHAGYAARRRALLEAGISLYELKRSAAPPRPTRRERRRKRRRGGMIGSSKASLHAKTFAADGTSSFAGSFNFDPRSDRLNTEMGFIIHSGRLARQIQEWFAEDAPLDAYEVRVADDGRIVWLERRVDDDGERVVRHETEPGATGWRRAWVRILSWLPIESLL